MASAVIWVPQRREDPSDPDRPILDNPNVQRLAAEIAPEATATDLGGAFSLNALLQPDGLVLRVHQPDMTQRRLESQQAVRQGLATLGLTVPIPIAWRGSTLLRCGGRWAELEHYISHEMLPATVDSYHWLFRAMGELHRALDEITVKVPRPAFSTYGPPGTLLRWLPMTEQAVRDDPLAVVIAQRLRQLLGQLRRQWIPARELPRRIVHGDGKLRNVVRGMNGETVYLDFGFMAYRPRVHELGYAVTRMLLTLGAGETPESPEAYAWENVPLLVADYEAASGIQISTLEWQALAPYIASSCLFQGAMCGFLPDAAADLRDDERRQLICIAEWLIAHPKSVLR